MRPQALPRRLAVAVFLCGLTAAVAAPWVQVPLCRADGSSISADRMEAQREAYQSPRHLVKAVQKRLDALGYRPGALDGLLGPNTRVALIAFQKDNGLKADGTIGIETLALLNLIRDSR